MAWFDTVVDNVDTYMASRFNDMVTALATGSTDNAIVRADGTDGHKFQSSPGVIADDGHLSGVYIYDYRDMMIQGCSVPNTNPATVDVEETGTNKNLLPYGQFTVAGENSEHLMWLMPFPDDWNSADANLGKIKFKFYWRPVSGSNDIKWQVAGKLLPDGDPLDVALATIGAVEDTVQNTTDMHVTSFTTAAVVSSAGGGGNTALFSVTRQAPAGTDCTGDIRLYRIEVQYIRTLA